VADTPAYFFIISRGKRIEMSLVSKESKEVEKNANFVFSKLFIIFFEATDKEKDSRVRCLQTVLKHKNFKTFYKDYNHFLQNWGNIHDASFYT